jgi:hypothetical protein
MFFMMEEVVAKCVGCKKINSLTNRCGVFCSPSSKWEHTPGGHCPMASHLEVKVVEKRMVNPLKASKRAAQGQSAE